MIDKLSRLNLAVLATLGSVSLLLGAFLFQAIGFAPCAMCLWQRWPHAAAILIGALFVMWRKHWLLPLGAIAAATTSGLGLYHTGVERDWWEGPTSCTSSGANLGSLAGDALLPSSGADAIVMCDDVVWQLFGLSMASYNFLFSALFVVLWIMAWRKLA